MNKLLLFLFENKISKLLDGKKTKIGRTIQAFSAFSLGAKILFPELVAIDTVDLVLTQLSGYFVTEAGLVHKSIKDKRISE